jgi:hypothetical protein
VTAPWSADDLSLLDAAGELEIAVGTRPWTPIWVVTAGGQVYVRTWHRRDTGWYGAALRVRRARVRVPGLETEVSVEDVGNAPAGIAADVDAAYRAKYGAGAGSMVTTEAVVSTLRLVRRVGSEDARRKSR